MTLDLSRTTFRRLVQLYLAALLLWVPILWVELTSPAWVSFSLQFDTLVLQNFGDSLMYGLPLLAAMGGLIGLALWMVISAVGLYWFQRWARFGFWASLVTAMLALIALDGNRPSFTSSVQTFVSLVDGMIAGAIVLLSYAKGYGADWFARDPVIVED